MYTIRELTAQDTEAFLQLKRIGLSTDPGSFVAALEDDPPSYRDAVRDRLARASVENGDIVLGAFAPGLVGIIAVTRDPRSKRRHKADLHGMYVVPEHRGRGLGKRLLVQALELARNMDGLEEIQLIVAAHNREACALYERFGFVRVWTERHALKVGDHCVDAHHMVMTLGSTADDERTRESPALTANR
jgi:ribosomal protein S18 acetylase RimI-like enzyme